MKKITYLLTVLILQACSSIHDISYEDKSKGEYLFDKKLKSEYTKFFVDNVFKNGSYVYAGPEFIAFNNFQMIKLRSLSCSSAGDSTFREKDGTTHEYLHHIINPYYGGKSSEDKKDFRLEFSAYFQSFKQIEKSDLNLIVELRCKKDVKCSLVPNIDFFHFQDPYDFSFRLEDSDKVISENIELSNFSDTEATAISNRMIFRGMGRKAAEMAIGKEGGKHYLHGYYNVQFNNETVSDFEFRIRNDLHFFVRR